MIKWLPKYKIATEPVKCMGGQEVNPFPIAALKYYKVMLQIIHGYPSLFGHACIEKCFIPFFCVLLLYEMLYI